METRKHFKAVFMDVDGTLLGYASHSIHPADIEIIQELYYQGIPLFIATGRDLDSPAEVVALEPVLPYITGFISSNGQHCFLCDGTEISQHDLDPEEYTRIREMAAEKHISLLYAHDGKTWATLESPMAKRFSELVNIPAPPVRPFQESDMPIRKSSIYITPEDEAAFLRPLLKKIRLAWTGPNFADFIPADIGKATGIREMCEAFRIAPADIVAFGDGENDLDMLRFAGTGVAMGNASETVKAAADHVTGTSEEAGIARFLAEHFI